MAAPAVGTVIDGYRFNGGDPANQASWSPVGKAGGIYADTLAREQAKDDVARLKAASEGQRQGYGAELTALQAEASLKRAPVGALSGVTEFVGRHAPILGGLPGFPNRDQTAALESMTRLQNMGALGDSQNLKGPMSDKDIAFLRGMQYDPTRPREYNQQVIEAQKWAARRQAAYGAALKSWTRTLGAPSAVNANGLDFDSWWGRYAAETIPPPGVAPRAASAPLSPPRKAAPANGGGARIISVRPAGG